MLGLRGEGISLQKQFYKNLVEVAIPIVDDLAVHPEPPVNIPTLPELKTLGTVSDLAEEWETHTEDKLTEFKNKANSEMEFCEGRGEGDQWYERQRIMAPKVKGLKGLHIEMLFGYSGYNGTQCLGWYHVTVQEVVDERTNCVRIKRHA